MSGSLAAADRTSSMIGATLGVTSAANVAQPRTMAAGLIARADSASDRSGAGTAPTPAKPASWMARTKPGLPPKVL